MTRRRRTPLGTQPPEVDGTPPLDISEWRSTDGESQLDEPSDSDLDEPQPTRAELMELGARRSIELDQSRLVLDERRVIELDEARVIEMEADEPSGPIEPPLPFVMLGLSERSPVIEPASARSMSELHRLGTQPPDDVADDVADVVSGTGHGTGHSGHGTGHSIGHALEQALEQFAAGTQTDAPALPRARTGGGRVAATEPAKVASGTIEPTDVVPKVDADEEHAVIVEIDTEWLERLDLPVE